MSEDMSNVPRRLRRFYRNGQPIPDGEEKQYDPPKAVEDKSPEEEPWMNPPKSVPRHIQRKTVTATRVTTKTVVSPPRGVFEKINENAKQGVPHLDRTLGLSKKMELQESLPNASEKALQTTPPNADVQAALNKLKELASKDANASSFHFTPVGGAPKAVNPEKIDEKTNPPIAGNALLSPRERMEMRKQRGGEPPEGSPSVVSGRPSGNTPIDQGSNVNSAHIRRRMGQRADQTGNDMGSDEPARSPAPSSDVENDDDFKSLFGTDKKKKKKSVDEDDDFGLDDDMPLLDDEK